jgi:hypothetical protein
MIKTKTPHVRSAIRRTISKFVVATICSLAAGATAGLFIYTVVPGPNIGARDFVVYWATGQQLTHNANPYDRDALLRAERTAGLFSPGGAMFMRNPPSALPLVYPLGFIDFYPASVIWTFLLILCLCVSVHTLWVMQGKPDNHRYLLGYAFGPAFICLINGQAALFALLGLVLFLRLHLTRPFIAGVSLWLCALKPHLFLPFGVVLLAWVIVSRSYKLLAGAGVAIAASCAVAYCFDPVAWNQYLGMLRTSGIEHDTIPCVSFLLRSWLAPKAIWLEYVPAALGCVWALAYFWPRRGNWDWMRDGSPLMLVSILAAPYCWLFDQVLAIPALLQGAFLTRSRTLLAVLALFSALIEIALFCNYWKSSAVYLWTTWSAPAWLVWYIVARRTATGSFDEGVLCQDRHSRLASARIDT